MDKNTAQALRVARAFVRAVQKTNVRLDAAYLYGSYAKGQEHPDSDIDIALVSRDLTGWVNDFEKIRPALQEMDARIEPVRFHPRDFCDENPLVWEIKQRGIPLLHNGKRSSHPHKTQTHLVIPRIVKYWRQSALEDWKHARSFFEEKAYIHALFFGYRSLEKKLKAVVVKRTRQHAPYELNLIQLAKLVQVSLTPERQELFARASNYSIDFSPPDEEIALKATSTREFTAAELDAIRKTGRWLANLLKS